MTGLIRNNLLEAGCHEPSLYSIFFFVLGLAISLLGIISRAIRAIHVLDVTVLFPSKLLKQPFSSPFALGSFQSTSSSLIGLQLQLHSLTGSPEPPS
ncbi:uncharacterized protein BP01DRAFT_97261 [Aspergillus saccharolyticus JOP 1030-1]|uniref:Uncharacterized protein n=1 Tax=Aspergillus saccharolyticus JOP 1030-1 TaxID=1450539 RepID=A0A318Z918_9EURO|nr:hypothetical protein BP01DRAFT_97261 [Aspergillus saccharolyticus JOP 1030-1]PYH43689.1 hypothetical protein BP01DRAFT_97261 [Aspergillus saccharolyticus JOP 1030-1]